VDVRGGAVLPAATFGVAHSLTELAQAV